MSFTKSNTIVLFDVDGTLTKPRNVITENMRQTLIKLRKKVAIAVVGGSDIKKIQEQLGENVEHDFDFVFSENGLMAYKDSKIIEVTSLKDHLGETKIKQFVNFVLAYLSQVDIPIKRGTFIEFRNGMINISPIGRNCSQQERDEFDKYDQVHKIRAKMVQVLQQQFPELGLKYSIGGQISFDVFPEGWDKTYCLKYLNQFENIFFYGDKTFEGGNDYEIFTSPRVKGNSVTGPEQTEQLITEKFLL